MTIMPIKVLQILPEFVDSRGFISRIIDQNKLKIRSILYIERKKGSVGASHYHKKDYHYQFVIKGKIKHTEKDMKNKKSKLESIVLQTGDLILVKPLTFHKDEFLEDTVFLAITTETRSTKNYEKDTVRVKTTQV